MNWLNELSDNQAAIAGCVGALLSVWAMLSWTYSRRMKADQQRLSQTDGTVKDDTTSSPSRQAA